MLADKISQFDKALRDNHPDLHTSLRPGIPPDVSISGPIREWFEWKDGQSPTEEVQFLDNYRFVSLEEARMQLRSARSGILTHPLQTLFLAIFARRTLYSWPLLVDGAGDGYFYSTLSRRVFHRFEGERDPFFPSFEGFVDFLVQLANMKETSVEGRIERELELLDQSAR